CCGDNLDRELFESATEEQAGAGGEEAEVHGSDEATDEVDADDVEGVIEAELELEFDREGADCAGDDAEQEGPARGEVRAGRCDGHETGDSTRCCSDGGGLTVLELLDDEPADDRCCGRAEGVDDDEAGVREAVEPFGSGVETEPAEPQDRGAEEGQWHVVRLLDA